MTLFPFVRDGGFFVCEDVETSYSIDFGVAAVGGTQQAIEFMKSSGTKTTLRHPRSAMEFFKGFADSVNRMYILGNEAFSAAPNQVRQPRAEGLEGLPVPKRRAFLVRA